MEESINVAIDDQESRITQAEIPGVFFDNELESLPRIEIEGS